MRSTVLFLAVLLACSPTPGHAQAATPTEAPILHAWLTALLPATTQQATGQQARQRKVKSAAPRPQAASQALPRVADFAAKPSVTIPTHDSNAP